MKRILLWFVLLNKRLSRRISFWLILAAVPLLVLALGLLAQQESGVATVAVYVEDESDPASAAVLERLHAQKGVLRYIFTDSEREAASLVRTSRADIAWILSSDLTDRLDARATGQSKSVVRVYVREGDSILQMLAREKLFAALYPELTYDIYTHYVNEELKPSPALTDDELYDYFHKIQRGDQLIEMSFLDGSTKDDSSSYLVMPVRGLMALLVIMAALASALYYLHDSSEGSFVWVSRRRRRLLPYAYHLIPVLDTAAVVFATLFIAGLNVAWYREIASIVLYMLACVTFAELLRQLLKSTAQLGVAIPILMLAMLALSPIFFDLSRYRILQMLFPPYYYLNGTHNPWYLLFLAAYILVTFAAGYAIGLVRERIEKE